MQNEYSGEDTPGGSTPTPDQSNIDDIGRVYGLQEEDSGALQAASEILRRRDRHRPERVTWPRPSLTSSRNRLTHGRRCSPSSHSRTAIDTAPL